LLGLIFLFDDAKEMINGIAFVKRAANEKL
jgi:hypothetical protein